MREYKITKDSDYSSIITSPYDNTTVATEGGAVKAFNKKITTTTGRKSTISYCKLNQVFPMNIIRDTQLSAEMDATVTMNVDDNDDVAIGDRVIMGEVASGKTIKVTAVNPGSVDNRLTLSEAITAADNQPVKFIRTETYNLNLYPKTGTTLNSSLSSTNPIITATQYTNPILTISTTESDSHYANPASVTYIGRVNKLGHELKNLIGAVDGGSGVAITNITDKHYFKITYSLTNTSGGRTFSKVKDPVWSITSSTTSDWTNSVPGDNGGTHLEMFNITSSGAGTTSYTITVDVLVKKFGTSDVTMNLNLSTIVTG